MRLPLVFFFGFLASLVVVGGMIWLFAAYETANLWPIFSGPRLSQDKWFEIVRNAVTTAAALGVGVTLFFSYRRQQTAEKTQLIAAEAQLTSARAQQTAAAALELTNKQHALDQSRRQDAVTAELRTRYAKTAEQLGSDHLAVRLAGIYSLAALADDWAELGNEDERQVCIDLMSAYFRSSQPGEKSAVRNELVSATLDVVAGRLRRQTPERKFWGRCNIKLLEVRSMPSLDGVILYPGGSLGVYSRQNPDPHNLNYCAASIKGLELNGGSLTFRSKTMAMDASMIVSDSRLAGGTAILSLEHEGNSDSPMIPQLVFRRVTLAGTWLNVLCEGWDVLFQNCAFRSGSLLIHAEGPVTVTFDDCLFESDVFSSFAPDPTTSRIQAPSVVVKDCTFENDAVVLESTIGNH